MTAMMAGYALARLRFPGRKAWFYLFVGSMLLPGVVGLIPLFQLYKSIGWYDTWLPLIVPAFLGGNPLFIFLARQYFLAIPYSIDEAAKIDGAGHLRIFVSVMLPLTRPAWITMAILAFQASWNDFLNPTGLPVLVRQVAVVGRDGVVHLAVRREDAGLELLHGHQPALHAAAADHLLRRAALLHPGPRRSRQHDPEIEENPCERTLSVTALACAGLLTATACSGGSDSGSSDGPVTVKVMTWESAETNAAIKKALADFKDDNVKVEAARHPERSSTATSSRR